MKAPTRTEAQKRALRDYERANRKTRAAAEAIRWAEVAHIKAARDEAKALQHAISLGAIKK